MKKTALFALAALTASSTLALAHSNDARQAEQQDWIEDGRNNGTITWSEGIKRTARNCPYRKQHAR
jgi:hypothetical protein